MSVTTARAIVTTSSFNNTTPPSDDPGFYNVGATAGESIIYLGNGWALTAGHVNTSNNTPGNTSSYGTVSFSNGSQSTAYGVANILPWLTGADLKLVNLTTSPNLPSLTISSSSAPVNARVDMIGNGLSNSGAAEGYFSVSVPSPSSGTWTWTSTSQPQTVNPIPSSTYFAGQSVPAATYQAAGIPYSGGGLHWGQNLITGNGAQVNDGSGAPTSTLWTTFNDPTYAPEQSTVASWEAQAELGDSGGGVFYKNPLTNSWELTGMMYAVGNYPNQTLDANGNPSAAANYAVYGNITYIADLSAYRSTILTAITPWNWTGANGSSWDTAASNWTNNMSGSYVSSTFQSTVINSSNSNTTTVGNSATFGDTNPATGAAITNSNIIIQAGGVAPASVDLTSNTVAYTFNDAAGDTTGISGGTSLIKTGTARVTLLGANTFAGPVQISAGSLNIQNSGALGSPSNGKIVTVNSGADLELQGGVAIAAIPLTLAGPGLANSPAGALDSVSGSNSYAGAITLSAAASIDSSTAGSTLTISGAIDENGHALTFAGAGNAAVGGLLQDSIGSGQLIKSGSGTLTLTNGNTYAGGTTVNLGLLKVDNASGSGTGNGPVVVNSGGTLGGGFGADTGATGANLHHGVYDGNQVGIIGGAVSVMAGAHLAPGNSVGTLTVAGLTVTAGSVLDYEFNNTPANDFTVVTNLDGLTLNGGIGLGAGFNLYVENTATPWDVPGTYHLLNYDGVIQGPNGIASLRVLDPQPGYIYTFSNNPSLSDVDLTISPVPEPSTLVLLGACGVWLLAVGRRPKTLRRDT